MSYQEKYLKYKNKYLNLKNQFGGDDHICPISTLNIGLKVQRPSDCNDPTMLGKSNLPLGYPGAKGYNKKFIDMNCYTKQGFSNLIAPIIIDLPNSTPLDTSRNLRICTWNIMGIDRDEAQLWLINKRICIITDLIKQNDLDIVCFQEASWTIYKKLTELLPEYNIYERIPDTFTYETKKCFYDNRYHDIECMVAIKKDLAPKKIIVEAIGGNGGYTNNFMQIEFENLHIFNCHLQAGTKFSGGLAESYIHYARCRQQLLQYIIDKLNHNIPSIILGDFNIDLNDVFKEDFPDFEYINKLKQLGFVDTWAFANPHDKEGGLTENTDTNLMRWNEKLLEKKARVDGILVKNIDILECKIIGNKEYVLVDESEEEDFKKNFTGQPVEDLIRKDGLLPIFASDHYGVISTLKINL